MPVELAPSAEYDRTTYTYLNGPQVNTALPPLPVYVRLPRPGQLEFYSGLSKGTLERILKLPGEPVKSIVLTQPGSPGRGVKCILLSSLLDYLATLPKSPPERLEQPKRPPNPAVGSRRRGRKGKAVKVT